VRERQPPKNPVPRRRDPQVDLAAIHIPGKAPNEALPREPIH
jgi:hypothetical protein